MKTTEQMTETMFAKIYVNKTYRPLNINEINWNNKKRESQRMTFIVSSLIIGFASTLTLLTACFGQNI